MNLNEIFTLSQTIIFFLTGCVVVWYTYETKKIREETSKQNVLLSEQLNITRAANNYEIEKVKSFLQPIFVCEGGTFNLEKTKLSMRNDGGYISDLSFETKDSVSISASSKYITSKSKFELNLLNITPNANDEVEFSFIYFDKMKTKGKKEFSYGIKHHKLIEKK